MCSEKDCECPRFQPQKQVETRCKICFHSLAAHKGEGRDSANAVAVPEVCDCGQAFPVDSELGNFCTKCGVRKGIRRKISKVPPRTELPPAIPSFSPPPLATAPVLRPRGLPPLSVSSSSVTLELCSESQSAGEKPVSKGPSSQASATEEGAQRTESKVELCVQCGHSYPAGTEDWLFCTECGARKPVSDSKAISSPSQPPLLPTSPLPCSPSSSSPSVQPRRHPDSSPPPSRSALKSTFSLSSASLPSPSVPSPSEASPSTSPPPSRSTLAAYRASTTTAPPPGSIPSLATPKAPTEKKLFCYACGTPFEASHEQFCSQCGIPLNSKLAQEARKQGASGVATEDVAKENATSTEQATQPASKASVASVDEGGVSSQDARKKPGKESQTVSQAVIPLHASATEGKKSNWIQADPAKNVFSDYEFKCEQHQILDLFRRGQFGAPAGVSALAECSTAQFTKILPVIACAIADTPIWAEGRYESLVKVLTDRSKSTPAIRQALHALKLSGLLDHPWSFTEWLEAIPTESPLFRAATSCASQEVGFSLDIPLERGISHPFDDSFVITNLHVAKVFNSNARPRLIEPTGRFDKSDVLQLGKPFILKEGDDLRQDVACIHIMSMMNNLWAVAGLQHDGLAVKSPCYGCLALTDTLGCIEFVPNSVPLKMVKDAGRYSTKAISRLITTGAGAFVAAYVLGVRDRHHDNILISKTDGSLFHIDFGYILGDQTTIDAGAFGITPDLKDVICSYGSVNWDLFVQLCVTAYKIIRDKSRLIISFAVMMMAPFQSQDSVRRIIAERLRLTLEEEAALAKIRKKVRSAPSKFKTKLKNVVHGIASSGKA